MIEDLNYILKQNFSGQRLASINLPSKPTRLEQHQIILQLFNYRLCDSDAKVELESKAQSPRQTDPATFPVAVIPKSLHRYLYPTATLDGKEKILEIDRSL